MNAAPLAEPVTGTVAVPAHFTLHPWASTRADGHGSPAPGGTIGHRAGIVDSTERRVNGAFRSDEVRKWGYQAENPVLRPQPGVVSRSGPSRVTWRDVVAPRASA